MKKSVKKFIAVVLTSLCVLGVPMVALAAPAATQQCSRCGGTAYYSGSQKVAETVSSHMHQLDESTVTVPCKLTVTGYVDTYRCNCAASMNVSRTEYTHQY